MLIVSSLWICSEILLARTKHSQSTDTQIDKSSLRVLWITIALSVNTGIVLGVLGIGYVGQGSQVFPWAGLILIVSGLAVRWLAIVSLKSQFTVDVSIKKDHRIVRGGVYRYVRHPAYAGSLLSFLGLGVFFVNYCSVLVIFVPICAAFFYRIRIEENVLVEAFGNEYINYCKSTKRLIPGIY